MMAVEGDGGAGGGYCCCCCCWARETAANDDVGFAVAADVQARCNISFSAKGYSGSEV